MLIPMCTGHFHSSPIDLKVETEYQRCLSDNRVYERIYNERYAIDTSYDIPYIGGYSRDGKTIYVDRHLPLVLNIDGTRRAVVPFITVHERTEKALIDILDKDYDDAHRLASFAVRLELRDRGISPIAYERVMDAWIKADKLDRIKKVPKDLDFKAYSDSRDIALINTMRGRQ